jgi:hypothetical protein
MNWIAILFGLEHLLFATLAFAAVQATAARAHQRWIRRSAPPLAAVLLLCPIAILSAGSAWLRFSLHLEHSPWLGTLALLSLQAVGILWLARRSASVGLWSVRMLWIGVGIALLLEWTTLINLQLRAQAFGAHLRLEAGQAAFRERPPPPEAGLDAAPLYADLAQALFGDGRPLDEQRWADALQDRCEKDLDSAELRAALRAGAKLIADLRRATQLPRCSLVDEVALEFPNSPSPLLPILNLSRALTTDARLRCRDGDFDAALADFEALERIAVHLMDTPLLIHALAASHVQALAREVLADLLAASDLPSGTLSAIAVRALPSAAESYRRAMNLEGAFQLNVVGQFLESARRAFGGVRLTGGLRFAEPAMELYMLLEYEREAAACRAGLERALAACELGPSELGAALAEDRNRAGLRRGFFATYMTPAISSAWPNLLRGELEQALLPAALAAARYRRDHGEWPSRAEELGAAAGDARLELQDASLRLVSMDPRAGDNPPSLLLPPGP